MITYIFKSGRYICKIRSLNFTENQEIFMKDEAL